MFFECFVLEPACPTASTVWNPLAQAENGNNGCYFRPQMEAGWLSSSPMTASRNIFVDETEDQKGLSVSAWSTYSSQETTKHTTDSIQSSADMKKSESISRCRLFGFDLKIPTKDDIILETAPLTPSNVLSVWSSDQKSDLSKDCKDQGPLQVSPKEVQSKQNTCTRSRTKVRLIFLKHICLRWQNVRVGVWVELGRLTNYILFFCIFCSLNDTNNKLL